MEQFIKIRGARQNNLKNIDLDIPKNKLVVLTGVSGSGKSSLAFDTLYAEGQRRYVESLSTYARQFLGVMDKPDVDTIEGLSPAISIDQKTTSRNPRSTVGTVTEIYDYLRLLYARIGHPHCPICGREISQQSLDQIVEKSLKLIEEEVRKSKKGWFMVLSPIVIDRKGEFGALFNNLKAKGYKYVRIDNYVKDINDDFFLIKTNKHTIEAVIDRMSLNIKNFNDKIFFENLKSRISDSFQQALNLSEGNVILSKIGDKGFEMPKDPKYFSDHLFSERFACPFDNTQISEIEPRNFSFNSPHGACKECNGLGKILKVEPSLIFNTYLSITEGGILPFSSMFEHITWYSRTIIKVCDETGINPREPIKNFTKKQLDVLINGTGNTIYEIWGANRWGKETKIWQRFSGIVKDIERRYIETKSDYIRSEMEKYMKESICQKCEGSRLKKESLSITIDGKSIYDITNFSINETLLWITTLINLNKISQRESDIAKIIIKEVETRLNFLISVGLEYLTLERDARSLSGGEAQRIRLASQIGSGLSGVLYILDEPTIGLHQKDNKKLINTLKHLRDLGNTVIVVEHDREMINNADHVVDFGPGAGGDGGQIVAEGSPFEIAKNFKSLTGNFISGKRKINIKENLNLNFDKLPIKVNDNQNNSLTNHISLFGCRQYNLKNIDVIFPLGKLVCITGVSGSGKSTLLIDTLYPTLLSYLNRMFKGVEGVFSRIEGKENIDKVILIDQSPIGRTPRSNPATYTGAFDPIREVFENTHEAKVSGFNKGRFSFNLKGGRCENCEGQGQIRIEMQFMNDIWITCDVCNGKRYNNKTLDITYREKNIAEVLALTINEAVEFFHSNFKIISKLESLQAVGLGYMKMGQPATTLSGGEAQRVKLATELSKKATGRTLYILDEPTTGLHFADVEKLLIVLKLLVNKGNSVFLIEHNLDVIRNSDWIIDLGPGGGDDGGEVIAEGTPNNIAKSPKSYTGKYLFI